MGRIICELERIYGVRQGSAGKVSLDSQSANPKVAQSDIADELNLDIASYKRYKKLTTLIPELQEMVDSGSLTTSVASRIIARLSPIDHYFSSIILILCKEYSIHIVINSLRERPVLVQIVSNSLRRSSGSRAETTVLLP
ncbi:MAG: hypothetical protein LKJ17_10615 [Oscillospiraceae bacterium]|jgi:hypothetical protein|nr:hypothetical protein [Oscillospiraceae bacterium]